MAIKFTVSAPGKVILNGEHSVVYNKPALAGVIQLRNAVELIENDTDTITINFDLFDNVKIVYQLLAVNILLEQLSPNILSQNVSTSSKTIYESNFGNVEEFVKENTLLSKDDGYDKNIILKASTAIVHLLTALEIDAARTKNVTPKLHKGFTLNFKSQIPIGAGLGSSASYGVCIAATFYFYSILRTNPNFFRNPTEIESLKIPISEWAFLSEKIMHGTPSGLDNTVCALGNVVKFTKSPSEFVNVIPKTQIHIMLVNTGVSRNTLEAVRNVKTLRETHTKLIDHIMNGMGSIVDEVVQILKDENIDNEQTNFDKLKRLFVINNNLLRSLGVSHPVLEEIFTISERHGFASKLTGAGVGGFAIILLPPNYASDEAFHRLSADLNHFQTNVTTIGGAGVEINL